MTFTSRDEIRIDRDDDDDDQSENFSINRLAYKCQGRCSLFEINTD